MSNFEWILLANCLLYFAAIVWATKFHFQSGNFPNEMKVVSTLSVFGMAIFVFNILNKPAYPFASTILTIVASGIFATSVRRTSGAGFRVAYDGDSFPSLLVSDGPYALVRHPFYLSYLLFWAAGIFAASSFFGAIMSISLFVCLLGMYNRAANAEERILLKSEWGCEYRDYRKRVGKFFPNLFNIALK